MKKQLLALALLGLLAALFWPRSAVQKKQEEASHSSTTSSGERGVVSAPIRATSTKSPEPVPTVMAPVPDAERRIVSLSSPEQREGESDLDFRLRSSWLEGLHSFEQRALMTKEQREQLVATLADAQEQAVINWKEINRALADPNKEAYAPEGVLNTFDTLMNKELLATLRTFLTHEQMVAFRRTIRVPDALTSGLILPLEITRASSKTDALSVKQ